MREAVQSKRHMQMPWGENMLDTPEVLRRPVQWKSSRGTVLWIRLREASRVQLMPGVGGGVLAELEFYPQRNGKLLANFKQRMNMTGLRFTKKKRLVHIVLKIGHSGIHL